MSSAPAPRTPPRARPAATGVAVLLALVLVGLAVVGVHDLAVARGWAQGGPWVPPVVDALDGLTATAGVVAASIAAIVVGVLLLVAALAPARRTHVEVRGDVDLWVSPGAVGALAQATADRAPGVISAETERASRRKVSVAVVTQRDGTTVEQGVREALAASLVALTPVTPAVRATELPR